MARYYCKKCRYSTIKSSKPESCNYCSARGSMVEEASAQNVIEDD
jgi:hypothetical protein